MIMRSCISPGENQAFVNGTILEFHVADSVESGSELPPVGEPRNIVDLSALVVKRLDANKGTVNDGFRSYHTWKPPYVVLDTLEAQGYKVIATNTAGGYYLVWTLQKPM